MQYLAPLSCSLLLLTACDPGQLSRTDTAGPIVGGDAAVPPTDPTDPAEPTDPTDPTDPGPAADPYPNATVGTRCTEGSLREYLILSTEPATCAAHAPAFETDDPARFVRIPLDGAETFTTTQTLCDGTSCAPTTVTVRFDGRSGTWSASVGGVLRSGAFTATRCDYDAELPPTAGETAVGDLRIREVAIFQGVKIPVAQSGSAVTPSAPIVAGREAMIRIDVEPLAGWDGRETVARLELGGGPPIEVREAIAGASSDADGGSTFDLVVPGERITEDVSFSVGIYDLDPACAGGGSGGGARYPASGTATLPARSMGGTFEVVIVPVAYDADGSGRLPDTSGATMDAWHDAMYGLFPVADLRVSVRSRPLRWSGGISPNGSGWSQLLNQCMAERQSDGAPSDTYYYCAFAPAASFRDFCFGGCVSGLGPVPSARDSYSRASIGLGYAGSEDTFAHEVGHSLGRPHAPCGGAGDAEAAYPYAGGRIGSWGYDVLTRELKDPSRYTDLMGYCDNQWISDYNYANLFERIRSVKGAFAISAPPRPFVTLVVEPDGTLVPGGTVSIPFAPDGDPIRGTWTLGSAPAGTTEGVFLPVDHLAGGILYLPAPEGPADAVTIPGFGSVRVVPR